MKNAVTTVQWQELRNYCWNWCDIIDAMARFVSNKVIEIQAGDEKEELTAETIINTWCCTNHPSNPRFGLKVNRRGFNRHSTFGKPTQAPRCPWWWTTGYLYNTQGQVTVLDASKHSCHGSTALARLPGRSIQLLQGVHT